MKVPLDEPIAIIGSACRFAGDVNSPSQLWEALLDPRDFRQEIPDSRFSSKGFYHPDDTTPGHSNVRHSYLLNEDPARFDAEFFGIKTAEANTVDPQLRWLMETVYEACETAGLPVHGLRGSDTSVYVGVMCNDFESMLLRDPLQATPTYMATGTAKGMLSNRLSYFFDWRGPSITIDTACSSSLVSLHMAVQALRSNESRVAVACGSNLILGPGNYITESKLKMLSPDGVCKMWDKDANGYGRGEGIAAVVLKTLSAALKDGDHIECIVRETGVNQDGGATPGITMPSACAQQALIRSTYAKAGLDPLNNPQDRPQYFEAHGTGTPAGDPVEAEAIRLAFFGNSDHDTSSESLYVGSVKTILGHTEGTAGLAGIIKASLALQNAFIPPNLHFNSLNARVAPFYRNMEIVSGNAREWPCPKGQEPRRASVNSFGFGGTNAHAILESYHGTHSSSDGHGGGSIFTPFIFSASSEYSLRAAFAAYVQYLDINPGSEIAHDLGWTLRQRRSVLAHRAYISATSVDELREQLASQLEDESNPTIGVRVGTNSSRILGIFTGQGAQFARVGAELVEESATARGIIRNLETHLDALLPNDRPSWSLMTELLATGTSSRISEAAISQPLCTAVQILLVDLLGLAGIKFGAVVGHSSGEIAAAYAAGALSARDAMCIAHFRGVYASEAASPNGKHIRGAMLAVGTSMADAEALCRDEVFAGRLVVAASNSSSSVTVSGDEDAIIDLQVLLEDEGKFCRRLRVDTAYHSRHMDSCSGLYVDALKRSGVCVQATRRESGSCRWFSSVHGREMNLADDTEIGLSDSYWAENMTQPVLFSQALRSCLLTTNAPGLTGVVEVGPHPALRGPALQTIKEAISSEPPYSGTLVRNINAVTALSSCLGFLWQHGAAPNLDRYERAMTKQQKPYRYKLLKGLPTYQWNHTNKYSIESRFSRRMRLRQEPLHPLLGHASPDSSPHHLIWRNLLRPATSHQQQSDDPVVRESAWLAGHRVQGQIVFPAAGYVATAIEATLALPASNTKTKTKDTIVLIEIRDLVIHQAVVVSSENDNAGVEVLIELAQITTSESTISAHFTYSAALGRKDDALTLVASANIEAIMGTEDEADANLLPEREAHRPHMVDVDPQLFYTSLSGLGYDYAGSFRSMNVLKRKHGKASCIVSTGVEIGGTGNNENYRALCSMLVHPAELDAAFQSLLLAYSYPGDDQLRSLHLPLRIECIRVNPALCRASTKEAQTPVDAMVHRPVAADHPGFSGDINIYTDTSSHAAIQVQNVQLVPLGGLKQGEDNPRKVFTKMTWVDMIPDGHVATDKDIISSKTRETFQALERVAAFYLGQFDAQLPADSPLRLVSPGDDGAMAYYLQYARHVVSTLAKKNHPWLNDTWPEIQDVMQAYESLPDMAVMRLVGETMPDVFRGTTTMLERFRETGLLDDYYVNGFACAPSGRWQSRVVSQVADRHPHLNILEIGAGTGGTTKPILQSLGRRFQSYTFTDVSPGFFASAAAALAPFQDRLVFKTLDIERDPAAQGFVLGTYDVVIASFVLHATASLECTLEHARALLRPGGVLVVGEGSLNCGPSSFIFGPLPGWWLGRGRDDGLDRVFSPHVSSAEWDRLLRATGFSGIDTKAPVEWEEHLGVCLFVSQAVDDTVKFLRQPLDCQHLSQQPVVMKKLVLVGGKTAPVADLVRGLSVLLGPFASEVHVFPSLADIPSEGLLVDVDGHMESATVLSVTDLDKPVFKDMTETDFAPFQRMFASEKTILWVTSGRLSEEPFSNMVVGFGRTAVHETAGLHLQQLDLHDPHAEGSARIMAETLLRLVACTQMEPVDERRGRGDRNILWPVEPEIVVGVDGRQLVPRLQHLRTPNNRYNSGRYPVMEQVDVANSAVAIHRSRGGVVSLERLISPNHVYTRSAPEPRIKLSITLAMSHALRTPLGHKFLVLGNDTSTGKDHLALIPALESVVNIPVAWTAPVPARPISGASLLSSAAAHLISMAVVDTCCHGQTVLVHGANAELRRAIAAQASRKDAAAVFVTEDMNVEPLAGLNFISFSRYLSGEDLWRLLPPRNQVSCFVDLQLGSKASDQILSGLPAWCRRETTDTLFAPTACENGHDPVADQVLSSLLEQVVDYIRQQNGSDTPQAMPEVLGLEKLTGNATNNPMTVADFTTSSHVPVRIHRLDSKRAMFRADRTYWMVGLSGALGVSLCDWMVTSGARHIVLSSRSPQIELSWVDSHRRNGVTITIIPCDVTDYSALAAVHAGMLTSHPPIAGVLNGAMVLRDTSIRNMTFAQLDQVVRPKVLGSLNLDRLFSCDNPPLDFFILLSSINCIIGNQGQANYAAANTFQCALAASRRRRGLAGVALNVGAIIGAGYIQRSAKRVLDLTVSRGAMMHLSEEDFHQLVAEAIAAEQDDEIGPELTTGLLDVSQNATERPVWFTDPKFAHLIVRPSTGLVSEALTSVPSQDLNPAALSVVRDQLLTCRTKKDVEGVVTKAFAAQLRHELQMTALGDQELMEMRSSEIGLDSLVSVDIRNWLTKTLGVNIPVLVIMASDTSMSSLVQMAVDKLPADLVPQMPLEVPLESIQRSASSPTSAGLSDINTTSTTEATTLDTDQDFIDWDMETLPPDGCSTAADDSTQLQVPSTPPRTIVLTGATGLLGRHLLHHILQTTPPTTRILCIAIRQPPGVSPQQHHLNLMATVLPNDPVNNHTHRVSLFPGDLALPNLGLSSSELSSIFTTADCVIHAGADTSHLKPYSSLRAANLSSTKELARLCIPGKIPIHYISSAGVGLFPPIHSTTTEQPPPEEAADLYPAQAPGHPPSRLLHHGGYIASKWASERLLERASEVYGLPVWIHRPSTIIREGADAEGDKARLDWLHGLVRYIRIMRAVPDIRVVKGALDLVYVRNVCEQIVGCVLNGKPIIEGPSRLSYVHEVGDIVVPLDHLEKLLEPTGWEASDSGMDGRGGNTEDPVREGRDYEVLPMAEWAARAVEEGLYPAVAALIEGMDGPGKPNYPRLRKELYCLGEVNGPGLSED